jgi:hypothetical protein
MKRMSVVKTGDRSYSLAGEWESMEALAAARPQVIARLDRFRDMLDDPGGDLGVTAPRSGEVVLSV